MEEVQLRANIKRDLKEKATLKAKAEGKSLKQVIEELLSSYVRGGIEQVQLTYGKPKEEVTTTTPTQLRPEDFNNHLDYVDYLERNGMID